MYENKRNVFGNIIIICVFLLFLFEIKLTTANENLNKKKKSAYVSEISFSLNSSSAYDEKRVNLNFIGLNYRHFSEILFDF